ncbi:hypothetical protein NAS92_02345 [Pantoea brenneri]|uniref:DUF6971 family protein n=1 Tax=Pantoea brenneri TaxID=472694 RepID=UPI00210CE2BF|nr:hypothetical protein [Pantoea brenneri]MCQ5469318.1 hypothetical protein [Pantoea brenneri]
MSIKHLWNKGALSYDSKKQTVTLYGQTTNEMFFREVTVTTALNAAGSNDGVIVSILLPMHEAGMSTQGFGEYSRTFANYLRDNRIEAERKQREVAEHTERMAAILATPEEIEKAVAERRANIAQQKQRFRKASAGF